MERAHKGWWWYVGKALSGFIDENFRTCIKGWQGLETIYVVVTDTIGCLTYMVGIPASKSHLEVECWRRGMVEGGISIKDLGGTVNLRS